MVGRARIGSTAGLALGPHRQKETAMVTHRLSKRPARKKHQQRLNGTGPDGNRSEKEDHPYS